MVAFHRALIIELSCTRMCVHFHHFFIRKDCLEEM